MVTNQDIARQFRLYAELLLLHQKDERLSDHLAGAAYTIQHMDEAVASLPPQERCKRFRPTITPILDTLTGTGRLDALDELVELTPAGLFDMMRIKGLGGKRLAVLWHTAKIDTVEDLLKAAKAGKLSKIPGFGQKTEQNIIASIEAANSSATSFHYADVADTADGLVKELQKLFVTPFVSLSGDIRRKTTTVNHIDLITAIPGKSLKAPKVKKLLTISTSDANSTTAYTLDEIPVIIHHTTPAQFYGDLFEYTGSAAHVAKVRKKLKTPGPYPSEEALYRKARLPVIPPELREDLAEWTYAKDPKPLITTADIKGVVHNHTTYSDGVDTLQTFVKACIRKKYEYAVISDHSKNAHYAGGLKDEKVLRQFQEIDRLNKEITPFKVFKSIECDILVSGDLDYDADLLKQFDLVIVSIHQQLKMAEPKATARLIKAIENPYTTIIGHMTGRQLLIRPGYPLDFKKVIDACAANGVIIEVNANPYRLDMDWSHIPYALEKGVMISINPDAHSIHEIDNIRWGVEAARKGGLTSDMTWNAQPLSTIRRWLKSHGP